MNCLYRYEDWERYVNQQVSVVEADQLEAHLAECDSCLTYYEHAIQLHLDQLEEAIGPAPDIVEDVMADIKSTPVMHSAKVDNASSKADQEAPVIVKKKKDRDFTTFFHYAVAASFAFLIYTFGFFDQFVHAMDQTEVITAQTDSWLTRLQQTPLDWWEWLIDSVDS
ncbi:anti-sigma factor family protein [Caldalkalibacillus salinus]|uniref:anti-sigma factor family protein n=1 Tax=Caldalkalibacillus salinus TaxID=2803787 RepID=UPI001922A42C|nr:zf-HC2 domain-containing protein [Caldalkalibacillus salinus]